MRCPVCAGDSTIVVDSRPVVQGTERRRRYQCVSPDCKGYRFTTRECVDIVSMRRIGRLDERLTGLRTLLDEFAADIKAALSDGGAE